MNATDRKNEPVRTISFSPPDISDEEIAEVVDTLKSGWITTGPKTKKLEAELSAYTGTPKTAVLGSATTALECGLRLLGVGPGDEVITSAYTYTAFASCACHVGATPVLVDVAPGSYEMDYEALAAAITPRTRAIIPVDIAGRMIDYDALYAALDSRASDWKPATERQAAFEHVPVLTDAAHSLGAIRKGRTAGTAGNLTAFSFHAVKNFTTAEGGALTWQDGLFDNDEAYREVMLMALHGQSKDALSKSAAGAWEYDIEFPGWKCNMTDIAAAMGLAQLRRYPALLARRRAIVQMYREMLEPTSNGLDLFDHPYELEGDAVYTASNCHLMLVRLLGHSQEFRNALIVRMGEAGIACNVHYKPLPMLSAYKNLGFDIADYPNAFAQFENEVTLPLHTLLSDDDVAYVAEMFLRTKAQLEAEGLR